jgi:hypothetical protein
MVQSRQQRRCYLTNAPMIMLLLMFILTATTTAATGNEKDLVTLLRDKADAVPRRRRRQQQQLLRRALEPKAPKVAKALKVSNATKKKTKATKKKKKTKKQRITPTSLNPTSKPPTSSSPSTSSSSSSSSPTPGRPLQSLSPSFTPGPECPAVKPIVGSKCDPLLESQCRDLDFCPTICDYPVDERGGSCICYEGEFLCYDIVSASPTFYPTSSQMPSTSSIPSTVPTLTPGPTQTLSPTDIPTVLGGGSPVSADCPNEPKPGEGCSRRGRMCNYNPGMCICQGFFFCKDL